MTSTLPHRLPRQRTGRGGVHAPPRPTSSSTWRGRGRPLRRPGRGAPRHGGALRRQGQPAPLPARRAGGGRVPLRRRQPGRGPGPRSTPAAGPDALVYSNPVKRRDHVVEAAALGVRLFVVDSLDEVQKVAEAAPGSAGAVPAGHLGRGIGLAAVAQVRLLDRRGRRDPHPGRRPRPRRRRRLLPRRLPAARPRGLGAADRRVGVRLRTAARPRPEPPHPRPGRRLPGATTRTTARRSRRTARPSAATSRDSFGTDQPQTLVEPGRGIVGDAGTLVSTVIGVVDRGGVRWVFLDAGVFTGLVETLEEAIRYRIATVGRRRSPRCRACSPGRRATAPTCSTRTGWCRCRSRSPRATRSGCSPPAPTPAATRPSGSTGSLRCRPCCGCPPRSSEMSRLDGSTRRAILAHAIAALAVALPWPLLLVLVASAHRGPVAARDRRERPDAALRALLAG